MLELATKNDRCDVNRLARQVHELHVQWRPDLYTMPEDLFPEELYAELVKNRELYVSKLDGAVIGFAWVRIRTQAKPITASSSFATYSSRFFTSSEKRSSGNNSSGIV